MKIASLLVMLIFFLCQDEPKKPIPEKVKPQEVISITIPKFYESTPGSGSWGNDSPKLMIPTDVSRKYALNIVDSRGNILEPNKEVDQDRFYEILRCILRYGVTDNPNAFHNLNIYFLALLRQLLNFGIINSESILQMKEGYINMNWAESLYYLDEAAPGTVALADWQNLHRRAPGSQDDWPRIYQEFLCEVKAGSSLEYLSAELDKRLDLTIALAKKNENGQLCLFDRYAKMYGILVRRGVTIRPEIMKCLARSYFEIDPKYEYGFAAASSATGLVFSREIIEEALIEYAKQSPKPVSNVVAEFRRLNLKFPKELAVAYRDALMEDFGLFEDVEYMLTLAGSESEPEFWREYGDMSWDWYKSRDNRKGIVDIGDYYHTTIESYRRVHEFVEKADKELADKYDKTLAKRAEKLRLSENRVKQLISAGDNSSVRTRDLIWAYRFLGQDPKKSTFFLEKLDKRVDSLRPGPVGVCFDVIGDCVWRINEFGLPLIPFADEIDLAAYLEDPKRTRELAGKIAVYAIARFKLEAAEVESRFNGDYACLERIWSNAKLPFWLDGKLVLGKIKGALREKALRFLRTPAMVELDGIINHYESLGFKIGLRSLAQYLFEYGLDLPARRAFHLAGLGKEAEQQCFSKKPEEFWQKKQEDFIYKIRVSALSDKK